MIYDGAPQTVAMSSPLGLDHMPGQDRDRPRVLIVDDDASLAEILSTILQQGGFDPVWCGRGDQAIEAFRDSSPSLVLLDSELTDADGVTVCRQIRAQSTLPIIILTARTDTIDVVQGLEAGADDYITKPFKAKELIARVHTRLRRMAQVSSHLTVADLVINIPGHAVTRQGATIPLTPLEFDLLQTFARRPGHVFSREELLRNVWGYDPTVTDGRIVNVHVQRLRAKIEPDPARPQILRTIRGIGYTISPNMQWVGRQRKLRARLIPWQSKSR